MLNRHRDTTCKCWFSVWIYYQTECNDVAGCRVWNYSRSSMVGKSPDYGATVVSPQRQNAFILTTASIFRPPSRPPPQKNHLMTKFSDHTKNTHEWNNTDHVEYKRVWFPLPIIYRPEKINDWKDKCKLCKSIFQLLISKSFSCFSVRTHSSTQ